MSVATAPALAPWWEWYGPYREFEEVAYGILNCPNAIAMPGAEKRIADAVENLYAQHKGEPAWDEAYRRWHEWDDEYPNGYEEE